MINRNDVDNFGHRPAVQRGLFESEELPMIDPGPAIKSAMRDADKNAQKKHSMSRDQVVDRMNELAEQANITCNGNARKITIHIYNKWLAAGERHHIPLRMLPIFCRAVGSNRPLKVYASFFESVAIISDSDQKKLQWAEIEIEKRKLSQRSRKLAAEVGL